MYFHLELARTRVQLSGNIVFLCQYCPSIWCIYINLNRIKFLPSCGVQLFFVSANFSYTMDVSTKEGKKISNLIRTLGVCCLISYGKCFVFSSKCVWITVVSDVNSLVVGNPKLIAISSGSNWFMYHFQTCEKCIPLRKSPNLYSVCWWLFLGVYIFAPSIIGFLKVVYMIQWIVNILTQIF